MSRAGGRLVLALALLTESAGAAVISRLTRIGRANMIDGRNPISFCNVLFLGNLIATLVLGFLYRREWAARPWAALTAGNWRVLFIVALLGGAISPALTFIALRNTSVTNVVLIGTLDIPLTLLAAWLLLRERSPLLSAVGGALALLGVSLSLLLQHRFAFMVGWGELAALGAVLTGVAGDAWSRQALKNVPEGFFNCFRNGVGAVIFFCIAMALFGPMHFVDLFSPLLWQWMVFYGGVVVALGEFFWISALKRNSASMISIGSAVYPVLAIFFAWLILGEVPMWAQWIGGAVVLVGVALSLSGEASEMPVERPYTGT